MNDTLDDYLVDTGKIGELVYTTMDRSTLLVSGAKFAEKPI